MDGGLCRDLKSRKLKPKKMIGDFAIRLHELRGLAVEQMEHTERDGSGAAIFFGIELLFVVLSSLFL